MESKNNFRYRISQEELKRLYETSKKRIKANPESAEKYQAVLRECVYYESEKEALEVALKAVKNGNYSCLILAKYKKVKDIFRIKNRWLVTDDWRVIQAADFLCLALMYDNTRLQDIVYRNINVDDVIAYYPK